MLFNSYEFLFVFLPFVLLGYYCLLNSRRPGSSIPFLIVCSLFFYGWWNPVHVALILVSIIVNFTIHRRIPLAAPRTGKALLLLGVIFNLSLLAYYKYADFFIGAVSQLLGLDAQLLNIVLPLAISFFTFQQIAFLVDTYKGLVSAVQWQEYMLFVLFFPQLIAGPIVHHSEMMPQFNSRRIRENLPEKISRGLILFTLGLAKKVLIADSLAPVVAEVYDSDVTAAFTTYDVWLASLAYTFQLYFDFSGYSDMAIGLALLFGIQLPFNFNSPYKARSIIEFWRRWHMTLSRFLKDYLYIALGGNRHGRGRRYRNLLLTMILGGLWHGANWTFVAWGVLHGAYLVFNHFWRFLLRGNLVGSQPYRFFAHTATMLAVINAWVMFRANSWQQALQFYRTMYDPAAFQRGTELVNASMDTVAILVFAALIAVLLPNTQQLAGLAAIDRTVDRLPLGKVAWRPGPAWGVVLALVLVVCSLKLHSFSAFLYFQF